MDGSQLADKRRRLKKWLSSDQQAPQRGKGAAQQGVMGPKLPVTDAADTAEYRPLLDGEQGGRATDVVDWDIMMTTTAASMECRGVH